MEYSAHSYIYATPPPRIPAPSLPLHQRTALPVLPRDHDVHPCINAQPHLCYREVMTLVVVDVNLHYTSRKFLREARRRLVTMLTFLLPMRYLICTVQVRSSRHFAGPGSQPDEVPTHNPFSGL